MQERHGLNHGSGRSPAEGNSNPLQHFGLGNPMDRGAWQAIVHEVARIRHDSVTKPPPPQRLKLRHYNCNHIDIIT